MNIYTQKQQQPDYSPPLELKAVDGSPVMVFPGSVVDNLRQMLTRVSREGNLPSRLSVIAALRGEGVTYTSLALATILANDLSQRVCVVDLNWWWPSESPLITEKNAGLGALLDGTVELEEVVVPTGRNNLFILPGGKIAKSERPVIARSKELQDLVEKLNKLFDFLILDIPAILVTSDAVPLASLGTACCLVIRQGVTPVEDVKMALDEIRHLPILGVVMNGVSFATPKLLLRLIGEKV